MLARTQTAKYTTARRRLRQDQLDSQFGTALPPYLRMSLATALEGLLDFYLSRYHADPLIQFLQQELVERPEEE